MKSYQKKLIPVYIVRMLVGFLFLLSGFIKINDPVGFSYKLDEYFHVFDSSFGLPYSVFGSWSLNLAFFIGIFETILALNLIIGFAPGFTTSALLGMIVFFTFLTGYSAVTKKVTDCGCFGDAIKLTPLQSFIKDIVLTILIGYLFVFRDSIYVFFGDLTRNVLSILLALLVPAYAWYCYNYLPLVDFLPYSVGSDLAYKTTTRGKDGQYLAYGYERLKSSCGFDEFKGKAFLIVIEDFQKCNPEHLKQVLSLSGELKKNGVNISILTSSTSEVRRAFIQQFSIPYCVVAQDQTTLKSMVRSNPGMLLLKDAKVLKKWSAKSIPNAEIVHQLLK